jgi:hypothetical protein
MDYADPGASYYEERYRRRVLTNLQRRAKAFGYVLQPTDINPHSPDNALSFGVTCAIQI